MVDLLSLKWKNHSYAFLQLLGTVRTQQLYSDVTLACSGKFYCAHRIILTACSNYFKEIFEFLDSNKPVVVLKDIDSGNLEALLDYMYVGEVRVKQSDLPALIKAAECLHIKGLAVADDEPTEIVNNIPKESSNSSKSKRKRSLTEASDSHDHNSRTKLMRKVKQTPANSKEQGAFVVLKEEPTDYKTEGILVPDQITIKDEPSDIGAEKIETPPISINDSITESECPTIPPLLEGASTSKLSPIQTNSYDLDKAAQDFDFASQFSAFDEPSENESRPTVASLLRWKCQFCSKSFYASSHLRRHVRIHTGERPFCCVLCPYQSTEKSNLKRHQKRHHFLVPQTEDTYNDKFS